MRSHHLFSSVFIIIFSACRVFSAEPVERIEFNLGSEQGIYSWAICGPFEPYVLNKYTRDNILDIDFLGGEKDADPYIDEIVTDKKKKQFKWQKFYRKHSNQYIPLVYKQPVSNALAYLFVRIISPNDTTIKVRIGADDYLKMFLNGDLIHEQRNLNANLSKTTKLNLHLIKGINRVLLKVSFRPNDGCDWGTIFSFSGSDNLFYYTPEIKSRWFITDQRTGTNMLNHVGKKKLRIKTMLQIDNSNTFDSMQIAIDKVNYEKKILQNCFWQTKGVNDDIEWFPEDDGIYLLSAEYRNKANDKYLTSICYIRGNVSNEIGKLTLLTNTFDKKISGMTSSLMEDITKIKTFDFANNNYGIYHEFESMAALLNIAYGKHQNQLGGKGLVDWAYVSEIDSMPQKYSIHVPDNYNSKYKIPLAVILNTANHSVWGSAFELRNQFKDYKDSFIVANVYGRASSFYNALLENDVASVVSDIKKNYNINNDKIILVGNCKNGEFVHVLAGNIPNMFSSVIELENILPLENIGSLINTPLFLIASKYQYFYPEPYIAYSYLKENNAIINTDFYGTNLYNYQDKSTNLHRDYNEYFRWTIGQTKTSNPNKIILMNNSANGLSMGWVEVLSIKNHAKIWRISAEKTTKDSIKINASNIDMYSFDLTKICSTKYVNVCFNKNIALNLKLGKYIYANDTVIEYSNEIKKDNYLSYRGNMWSIFNKRVLAVLPGYHHKYLLDTASLRATLDSPWGLANTKILSSWSNNTEIPNGDNNLVLIGNESNNRYIRNVLSKFKTIKIDNNSIHFAGKKYSRERYLLSFLYPESSSGKISVILLCSNKNTKNALSYFFNQRSQEFEMQIIDLNEKRVIHQTNFNERWEIPIMYELFETKVKTSGAHSCFFIQRAINDVLGVDGSVLNIPGGETPQFQMDSGTIDESALNTIVGTDKVLCTVKLKGVELKTLIKSIDDFNNRQRIEGEANYLTQLSLYGTTLGIDIDVQRDYSITGTMRALVECGAVSKIPMNFRIENTSLVDVLENYYAPSRKNYHAK